MDPSDSQGNLMYKPLLLTRVCILALVAIALIQMPTTSMMGQAPHDPATCSHCQNGNPCVPGMIDYPALQKTYGNPYRIMDCRNGECESSALNRWKRSMQASHWGYPDYFHRNSYGYANRNAFANNIRDGAIEKSTLYLLDFYPEDSPHSHMLTPKGLERLEKAVCVNTSLSSPLRIEKCDRPELNEMRRQWLAEHPSVAAAGIDANRIQWVSKPVGIQASEAIYRYQRGLSASSNSSSGNPSTPSAAPMFQGGGGSTGSQNNR